MNDPVDDYFSGLPRVKASPGFTSRVLADLDRQNVRRPDLRFRFALMAALLALVVCSAVVYDHRQRETALLAEHATLRAEIEELKRFSADAEPFISVGGDRNNEYVIDLRQVIRSEVESRRVLLVSDPVAQTSF
jgi:hypothetical protein